MINFKKYNEELSPSMLVVMKESLNIFESQTHFVEWVQRQWRVQKVRDVSYDEGDVGVDYHLEHRIKSSLQMRLIFSDCNTFHVSDPTCNIENTFYLFDQLRKDRPELDGKLIFLDTYGTIVRFPFDCSNDELCRRIGLDGEFHDHDLMQEFGLE